MVFDGDRTCVQLGHRDKTERNGVAPHTVPGSKPKLSSLIRIKDKPQRAMVDIQTPKPKIISFFSTKRFGLLPSSTNLVFVFFYKSFQMCIQLSHQHITVPKGHFISITLDLAVKLGLNLGFLSSKVDVCSAV